MTAVRDLVFCLVCGEEVDCLVLVLVLDRLDGLANGFRVGRDGDAHDQSLGLGVGGEVVVDGVDHLLVLCLESSFLEIGVFL